MKKTALAKIQVKKQLVRLEDHSAIEMIESTLVAIAEVVTNITRPDQAAFIHSKIGEWEKTLEDIKSITRQMLLSVLRSKGKPITENGTLGLDAEGWHLEARVRKTGYDDKKVEAYLRAKKIPVERGMTPEIKYKASVDLLNQLVQDEALTKDELDLLKADLDYNVQTPKKLE